MQAVTMAVRPSRLKRPWLEMPPSMQRALEEFGLMDAYRSRPPYQQNDYVCGVLDAKRPETRHNRITQIPDELEAGDVYMGMAYRSRAPSP